MRRLSYIVLAFLLVAILAGCGKSSNTKQIRLMVWETGASREMILRVIDKFEKEHPGFEVKLEDVAVTGYESKLLTMFSGNSECDISECQDSQAAELIKKGRLLVLDPYMKAKGINRSDFFEQPLYMYTYNGRDFGKGSLYGLPKDWSPSCCLVYNKTMLDKEGIKMPNASMSWDEAAALAKKLTKRGERGELIHAGLLGDFISPAPMFQTFLAQNGASIFSEDGTRITLDSPKAIETFKYWSNVHRASATKLSEFSTMSLDQMVGSGKVCMGFGARWGLSVYNKITKDKWMLGHSLHRGSIRANYIWPPCGYMISKSTKHPKETVDLLMDLCAGYGQEETAKLGWNIPIYKKAAEGPNFAGSKTDGEMNRIALEEVKYAKPFHYPSKLNAKEFNSDFSLAVEKILTTGADVETTLKELTTKYNAKLAK